MPIRLPLLRDLDPAFLKGLEVSLHLPRTHFNLFNHLV